MHIKGFLLVAVPTVLAAQVPDWIQVLEPEAMPKGVTEPVEKLQRLASNPGLPNYTCDSWDAEQLETFETYLGILGELTVGVMDQHETVLEGAAGVDPENPNSRLIFCLKKLFNLNVGMIHRIRPIVRPTLVSPTAELNVRRSLAWSRFYVLRDTVDRFLRPDWTPPRSCIISGLVQWLKASHFVKLEIQGFFDLVAYFLPKNDGDGQVQSDVESLSEQSFETVVIASLDNKIRSSQHCLNHLYSIAGETVFSVLGQTPDQLVCGQKLFEVGFGPGKPAEGYLMIKEQFARGAELSPRTRRLVIIGMIFQEALERETLNLNLRIAQLELEYFLNVQSLVPPEEPDVERVLDLIKAQPQKSARR